MGLYSAQVGRHQDVRPLDGILSGHTHPLEDGEDRSVVRCERLYDHACLSELPSGEVGPQDVVDATLGQLGGEGGRWVVGDRERLGEDGELLAPWERVQVTCEDDRDR
mgnify:CR=1 FL=1